MDVGIMVATCDSTIQVTIDSIPGTYTVSLDGVDDSAVIPDPATPQTVLFEGPFTGGTTYAGYVEPFGIPECRVTFNVLVEDCDPEITYVCDKGSADIEVTGCKGSLSIHVDSGPGTPVGNTITGADETTTFTVTDGVGCSVAGLTIADGTNETVCDGGVIECTYFSDIGTSIEQGTLDTYEVTSFILDGIQYVTTPVGFGTKNTTVIGAYTYLTNVVDTLNSIGAPDIEFNYPTEAQIIAADGLISNNITDKVNILRILVPDCLTWEIIFTNTTFSADAVYDNVSGYTPDIAVQYGVEGTGWDGTASNCTLQENCPGA